VDLFDDACIEPGRPGAATAAVRQAATGTALSVNGLEADTLYRGEFLAVAVLDGALGWQSRFTSGGAWDAGASDYAYQFYYGAGSGTGASAGNLAYGSLGTQDAGTAYFLPMLMFSLYTGNASRRARLTATAAYIATDGSLTTVAIFTAQRNANGAIADSQFLNTTSANGLGAGSRVLLEKLG